MSKSNKGKFARRDTIDSLDLFYDVMLYDRKIKNEAEKENVEASYFAMCLLLPREPFLEAVNNLGGIDECYAINNIKELSKMFNVEPKLVRTRLKDLSELLENEQQVSSNIDQNYSENNIENVRKSINSSQFSNKKKFKNENVKVMIGSGEDAIFVTKKRGERYMLDDGTFVIAGDTPEQARNRIDDRIDDAIHSKPVAFVKKLKRRINNKHKSN